MRERRKAERQAFEDNLSRGMRLNGDIRPGRHLDRGRQYVHIVHFPSRKNRASVVCEGRLEADFCLNLEFDPGVVSYRAQPLTLRVRVRGKTVPYTPDFEITDLLGRQSYVEVKPALRPSHVAYLEKIAAARAVLRQYDRSLEIQTEAQIRSEPRTSTLRLLYAHAHAARPQQVQYLLSRLQETGGVAALGDLRARWGATPEAVAAAFLEGAIRIDLTQPYGPALLLWIAP